MRLHATRFVCQAASQAMRCMLAGLLLSAAATGAAQDSRPAVGGAAPASQAARKAIYDERADAKADIAAALARAKKDNKRVLLMFGGNWCGWCHKLHGLFETDPAVSRVLLYEYERVMVDIGRWDKQQDVAQQYGAARSAGVPFLVVLDADGNVLVRQETGVLEQGEAHSPEKVRSFLEQYKATPQEATLILDAARRQADQDGRLLMVRFVAPWCGWCHELDRFLDRPEVGELLGPDFLPVKIDVDRMTGGNELYARYHGAARGGVPWFAILDGRGTKLDTSEGPRGNVGYPMEPHEIEHFLGIVRKHAKKLDAAGLKKLEALLNENARRIRAERP